MICGYGISACRSGETVVVKTNGSSVFPSELSYFSPVYSFDENFDFEVQARTAANFVKYTNHGLDSVITNYPARYNLREKIVVEEQKAGARILDETALLFHEIGQGNAIEGIVIPETIDSVATSRNSQFILLSYVKPVFKSERLKSGNLHLAVLDVKNNKILSFGKTGIMRRNEGYSANVADAFDKVLRKHLSARINTD